nr:MAG: putative capsid protein [Narnaviridae sp.]
MDPIHKQPRVRMTNVRSNSNNRARSSKKSNGRRLRGRGDYTDDVSGEPDMAKRLEKKIDHIERFVYSAANPRKASVNQAASMAGRALGTAFGQGDLGAFAGDRLARLFGHGDYRVSVKGNSLMAGLAGPTIPKFSGDGRRGVRLTEREFLGNIACGTVVSGSSVFTNQTFDLNPTNTSTFPWLSKIATLFDQWDPHGIVFEFITTSSTFNGTSQALGAVIMATDYDAEASNYSSKQEMENADYACSSVPSANLVHGIECDPKERPLPVMYTTVRNGLRNFSSLGDFQIATQGCSVSNVVLGELWISYDITFYKKQLVSEANSNPAISVTSAAQINGPLIIPTNIHLQRGITLFQEVGVGTRIVMPPNMGSGRFSVSIYNDNLQAGDVSSMTGVLTNCTLVNAVTTAVTVGTAFMRFATYEVTAPGAYIRLGLKTTVAATVHVAAEEVASDFRFGPV